MSSLILAIDPGNVETGYVLMTKEYTPLSFGKVRNEELRGFMYDGKYDEVVIEMVASYGMPVGATVFETCVEIGRYTEIGRMRGRPVFFLYRKEVKMNICRSMKANDSTIRQALVDRFAKNTPNKGKGYKKAPGFFYGFRADIWQAYALGVTFLDERRWMHNVAQT